MIKIETKFDIENVQIVYKERKKREIFVEIIFALIIALAGLIVFVAINDGLNIALFLWICAGIYVPLNMVKSKLKHNNDLKNPNVSPNHK